MGVSSSSSSDSKQQAAARGKFNGWSVVQHGFIHSECKARRGFFFLFFLQDKITYIGLVLVSLEIHNQMIQFLRIDQTFALPF